MGIEKKTFCADLILADAIIDMADEDGITWQEASSKIINSAAYTALQRKKTKKKILQKKQTKKKTKKKKKKTSRITSEIITKKQRELKKVDSVAFSILTNL